MESNPLFWLRPTRKPGAGAFAALFALDSMARATVVTVLYLQAKDLGLPDRDITLLTNVASLSSLAFSFLTPLLMQRFRRRWVYTGGIMLGMCAVLSLGTATMTGEVAGLVLRALSSVAINIGLTLYVMDFIPRHQMIRSEPLRLFSSCLPWGLGPWIGVELYKHFGVEATSALSFVAYAGLMVYFWYLRLSDNPAVAAATRPPPNPLASLKRFVAQPRLMLGWVIAFGRSAWWSMFFVYPTLYLRNHAVDDSWTGALTGAGNILLLLTLPIGWLAQRIGIRRPIVTAFLAGGGLTLLTAVTWNVVPLTALLFLCGAVFVVCLDALGNIPFMRAVRSYERPQMTALFRTYIDLGDLLPGLVYLALQGYFDLRSVFIASGILTLAVGLVATRLPKRM
ncbi:MFS transporter [Dongia sedimenti]|uniref:MFS transporter n=1 Tax=Dongia sedimenti TaxID=3064282 RepID=A0ABU0YQK3_9PROT|nr:MFS transporter [Rhodospirillaceae bacterium R-7]